MYMPAQVNLKSLLLFEASKIVPHFYGVGRRPESTWPHMEWIGVTSVQFRTKFIFKIIKANESYFNEMISTGTVPLGLPSLADLSTNDRHLNESPIFWHRHESKMYYASLTQLVYLFFLLNTRPLVYQRLKSVTCSRQSPHQTNWIELNRCKQTFQEER